MFTIMPIVVAVIWVLVIIASIVKIVLGLKKGKTILDDPEAATTDATDVIAGMPASQYYAQQNNFIH